MPRRKRECWAADCETDPFKIGRIPQPFIWGAYEIYTGRYETFTTAALFANFFEGRKCTVYFHNGGKFDGHYLKPYFSSDQNILIINGRIARFKIGQCEVRDSFNLIPVALAQYQKEKIDYGIFEEAVRLLPENAAQIEAYLKSDCVNLASLLRQFFDRYGKGLTQAGTALKYWAKNYNNGNIPRQSSSQFERYRPYYYGGRVECFVSGFRETPFKIADKNSAYPHAMLSKHPISTDAVLLSGLPAPDKIPQCFISLRAVSRGAFPFRLSTGELIFPRDDEERVYHITGWEFATALALSKIEVVQILEVHYFRETVSFREYIEHFYLERKIAKANDDKAGDLFAKLFMNSCYGAFAMNPENYHEYMLASAEKMAAHLGEGYAAYHPWGDGRELLWRKLPIETQQRMYKNVATAASITGFVRAGLFRDLCEVQSPLYCDTDSISASSITGLELGNGLGQWKVELECDAYAIAGKKLYAKRAAHDSGDYRKGDWKTACKGVNLTAQEIIAIAKGETVDYAPAVPTYSITRAEPRFIGRRVRMTAKARAA